MSTDSRQAHWQTVYTSKAENEVSWYQESPAPSLELIARRGATPMSAIIDIGGGASRLVDALVAKGFQAVTVLDLSEAALTAARNRLGDWAAQVRWIVADVTTWEPPEEYALARPGGIPFPHGGARPSGLRRAPDTGLEARRACDRRHICAGWS